jgi:hypothetical protein
LGLVACTVAAVLGAAGAAIRTRMSGPPALSPLVDLLILGAIALALFLWARHGKGELAKFRYLQRQLAQAGA